MGDASADLVLSAMEASGGPETWRPLRPRFEHGDGLTPDLVARAAALGVIVVANPSHLTMPEMMLARYGAERMATYQPMRSLLAAGVTLAIGSDGPPSPYLNILFAVTHPTNPREALTREQAVTAYTRGSAFAEFAEAEKGTLAPGMLADLAVLSQDIFKVEEGRLPETSSVLTIIGGRVVTMPHSQPRKGAPGDGTARCVRFPPRARRGVPPADLERAPEQPALRDGHAGRDARQGEGRRSGRAGAPHHERADAHRVQARAGAHRGAGAASWRRPAQAAAAKAARALAAAPPRPRAKKTAARKADAGRRPPPRSERAADGGHRHRVLPGITGAAAPRRDAGPGTVSWPSTSPPPPPPSACATTRWTSPSPGPTSVCSSCCAKRTSRRVVHAAFFTNPRRDTGYAHELESIGTLNLLAASAAAGVERVVLRSFTAVYGARGHNPNFLTEDHPLQPSPSLAWVRDKLEAEQHAAAFARRYPGMTVTVLRFAPLFGPGVHNFYTRIFDHRVVPLLMGYDPLLQLLHPDDAVAAVGGRRRGGAARRLQRGAETPIPILTAVPPGRQGARVRPAPRRVRGRRPAVGGRAGRGPGRVRGLRALPVRGGRGEGARDAGLHAAVLEPRLAWPPTSGTATRAPSWRRRRRAS